MFSMVSEMLLLLLVTIKQIKHNDSQVYKALNGTFISFIINIYSKQCNKLV